MSLTCYPLLPVTVYPVLYIETFFYLYRHHVPSDAKTYQTDMVWGTCSVISKCNCCTSKGRLTGGLSGSEPCSIFCCVGSPPSTTPCCKLWDRWVIAHKMWKKIAPVAQHFFSFFSPKYLISSEIFPISVNMKYFGLLCIYNVLISNFATHENSPDTISGHILVHTFIKYYIYMLDGAQAYELYFLFF